ncbi:ABC transporter substrate-binding protein [Metabacillus halosaccharovorans]|uniref:ABC transporter substrate-binding protein n=1 Tax=Metabacillus halosaccharovorans TaxID=930124 RepID=UPI00203C96AF|nr:sugar ABC transporter substrate-binding protein [Metabacillus halosaccharovorans]MCM3443660.1 sugar ABC transporter substrate-binding protein [Metabacillus halosaccharovorans]
MKKLSVLFMIFLLLLTTVACSGGTSGEKDSEGKTTVSFSYWGGDSDTEMMEEIRAEFEKVHPEINVKLVLLPDGEDYAQKQTVMMSAGTPYDVIQFAEESLAYASRGVLEDLTPYIEKDQVDLSKYYDVAIDAYTHDDKVYGLPLRVGSMVMFYNKSLFDKHGLEYPNENWTWEDVTKAAEKITDTENGVFGVNKLGGWWAGLAQGLHSFGGSVLSEDKTEFNLDSPESVEALETMQTLTWDKNVAPSSTQIPEGVNLWTSGKLGMMVDGLWWIAGSQNDVKDFEWDITTAPAGIQDASPTFSNAYHMAKASKNKEAAWEVIKFWTGEEAQKILAGKHGDVPTMKEVAESDLYLNLEGKSPENFSIVLDSIETAFAPEVSLMWSEINKVVTDGVAKIIDMNKPIEDVMPGVKTEVDKLLEEAERIKESKK